MKFCQDKTGKLAKLLFSTISKNQEYNILKNLNFLLVWREGKPAKDGDGGNIAAQVRVLPNRLRDLFGFDVEIEVCKDIWDRVDLKWKIRLLWHELRHFYVEVDEDTNLPVKDKENRIAVSIVPHDLVIRTFKDEIIKFGVDIDEVDTFKFMYKTYSEVKKGKTKKYARPGVLRGDSDGEGSVD